MWRSFSSVEPRQGSSFRPFKVDGGRLAQRNDRRTRTTVERMQHVLRSAALLDSSATSGKSCVLSDANVALESLARSNHTIGSGGGRLIKCDVEYLSIGRLSPRAAQTWTPTSFDDRGNRWTE